MKRCNLDSLNPTLADIRLMETEQSENEKTEYVCKEQIENRGEKNDADNDYLGNSMRMYLAEIGKIPLLSAEEEIDLGKTIREGGEKRNFGKQ